MTTIEKPRTTPREQTRARYPVETGFIERDGVRVFCEMYGDGEPSVGNGRSSRPRDVRAYDRRTAVGDALAVLGVTGIDRAVAVSSCGRGDDLILAAEHPERVSGLISIAPDVLLTDDPAEQEGPYPFDEEPQTLERWAKWNRHYWLRDWPGFLESFFTETFTELHSNKQIEDAIWWG